MPTIQIKTSVKLSFNAKEQIKSELGEAIALIPGKSEQWLMVLFGTCEDLYFQGSKAPNAALVEVGIKGNASRDDFGKLGKSITDSLVNNAEIDANNVYISYSEFSNYSWNGNLL